MQCFVPVFQLFEGMKAYRCEDQSVKLFRPDMNAKRMLSSAKRASLPVSLLNPFSSGPGCLLITTIVVFNPSRPHDALKHDFRSLKTDLIFLQQRVLEQKFP